MWDMQDHGVARIGGNGKNEWEWQERVGVTRIANPDDGGKSKKKLKLKCTQYPAIHTNYSLSNCTISNKKDFNRSSDFLVIN